MVFNQYTAGTQVKMYNNDRWEEKTPHLTVKGLMLRQIVSRTVSCDASRNMIMKNSQDARNGKIRIRSGRVSCRQERLGIDI